MRDKDIFLQNGCGFYDQKVDSLTCLLRLTVEQEKALLEEDIDRLQQLIDAKQEQMDRLERCSRCVHHSICTKQYTDLLQQIHIREQANLKKANAMMNALMAGMKEVQQGRRGISGYKQFLDVNSSVFFDQKVR